MKKLSIMLFALVAFSLASWASVTITPQMAVNIVKQQRTSAENLKARYASINLDECNRFENVDLPTMEA